MWAVDFDHPGGRKAKAPPGPTARVVQADPVRLLSYGLSFSEPSSTNSAGKACRWTESSSAAPSPDCARS